MNDRINERYKEYEKITYDTHGGGAGCAADHGAEF